MPPAEPVETEIKFRLAPQQIERFRRNPLLKSACTDVEVDSVYFDTPDCLLRRSKMALRLRRIDGRWMQTLKTEGARKGALTSRGEWETPARMFRGKGRLDVKRLSDSPLAKLLAKQNHPVKLGPVFRTRFRRAQWRIERAGSLIEVALDVGEIGTLTERKERREPICEVELELKVAADDGPTALLDLALELVGADSKRPLALTPMARSKAERGYQLITPSPPSAVKASAKGFIENISPKITTARALRAVVAHGLAVLTVNVELLLRNDDPEYVHQARVALRRVRSAIRLFDRNRRDMPRRLADELRWFARTLGEARDLDVAADETLPGLTAGIGADAVDHLVERADQQRRQARKNVRRAARSARYCALVLNGERWCLTPAPAGAELLGDAAVTALRKASKKLLTAAHFFSALPPAQRHRVRILAKRLRYALDLFSVALPQQRTVRYIDSLSTLQDVLGELNDAWVLVNELLAKWSRSSRIRTSVREWLAAAELPRMREAERQLLNLSKLTGPWA